MLERELGTALDAFRTNDKRMAFCVVVDRNGYLPVHNREYSHPQRPDDPAWNMSHCRNRLIFDSRAGLCAARNTRPYLVQSNPRHMGGGVVIMMKEFAAPIRFAAATGAAYAWRINFRPPFAYTARARPLHPRLPMSGA